MDAKLRDNKMKRLFRIFELSKNEQRVVLIVMFVLLMGAFIGYERRVGHFPAQRTLPAEVKSSPSPVEIDDEH
jgi:hypothetical protein